MSVDARIAGNIYSLPGQIVSFAAGAAITMGQPVYITAPMTVSPAIARTHNAIGVAVTNQPTIGRQVSVLMGCPIVYMSALDTTVVAGVNAVASTGGELIAADVADQAVNEAGSATYTFSVSYTIGVPLETAAAAHAIVRVAVMQKMVCLTP